MDEITMAAEEGTDNNIERGESISLLDDLHINSYTLSTHVSTMPDVTGNKRKGVVAWSSFVPRSL